MVDSHKFADFTEKAKQNIDQIKIGLLRHDKNPDDREFLNDISKALHSIKNAAVPFGLPRITDLCNHLESLVNLIREEKKELHQEIIITIASCRDRLSKFVFELETVQGERAKAGDLITRIQQHIDDYNKTEEPEPVPALSGADSDEAQAHIPLEENEVSLLPEEIVNKDYDKELFQIFIDQLQQNISLLRALTDSFANAPRQDIVLAQCSNLVGKLQSSANYMGYDQLAEYFLQWVAELELAGVDLSLGIPISFDSMDQKIKEIAALFPEIEDKPADPAELRKTERTFTPPPSVKEAENDDNLTDTEEFQDMFSSMDEIEDEKFDDDLEPIAALSGARSPDDEESDAADGDRSPTLAKKESRGKKVIEIDGSFLEEEKESENYDEELFQIFVQLLQENISQLQLLTDRFANEPNKTKIIDTCSNLVGKLQSSANYMGYERLAEFYLQWIAELEMTGVEQSLGSDISFDFMQEKIDRIAGLFPEIGSPSSAQPRERKAAIAPSPEPEQIAKTVAPEPEPPIYDDLIEDEEEEPLAEGIEPIAGLSDDEFSKLEEASVAWLKEEPETGSGETKGGEFSEAVDERLESFFADIEEPEEDEELETSFMEIASLSDEEEEEPLAERIEPIAGLSDATMSDAEETVATLFEEQPVAEAGTAQGSEFSDALDDKLDTFFDDIEEIATQDELDTPFIDIASVSDETEKEPAAIPEEKVPAPVRGVEDLFDDQEEDPLAEKIELIAGVSDQEINEPEQAAAALFEEEPVTEVEEAEGGEFLEAVDEKLESFFTSIQEPEGDEELETTFMEIASISEEEDESLAEGIEPIAGVSDEELTEPEEIATSLFEEEPVAETAEGKGAEFSDAVDEELESFFADIEESEDEDLDTGSMEIASITDDREEEPVADKEEVPAPDSSAEYLFEEEEKESLAEGVESIAGISSEVTAQTVEVADGLFEEEPEAEPEEDTSEDAIAVPLADEELLEDIDAFFGKEEDTEVEEIPPGETAEELASSDTAQTPVPVEGLTEDIDAFFEEEAIEEAEEALADELTADLEAPMPDEAISEEESIEEMAAVSGETAADEEAVAFHPDEMLTDEELLQEIEGPTVGEEVTADTDLLLPEISEKVVSALSEKELIDEELFRKLEGAISTDEAKTSDIEDLVTDEDIFADDEIAEPLLDSAPERQELFQKLSSALQSLDEETGEMEETEDSAAPEPEPEFDSQLFDKLINALESPSEQAEISGYRPIDQVMEEILSGAPLASKQIEPVTDYIPKKLAASEIKQIIRMDTDKVDHLMNQVVELNTNRSTLRQLFAEMNDLHHHYLEMEGFNKQELKPFKDLLFRLGDTSVSLNRLSSEIREGVLKVRMVPIGLLFDRYHELVNRLTSRTRKQVELEINGEETELEKMVIDEIYEPLIHIISNAVEHGIETVEERKSLGKDENGKIKLDAYHENNEIVVEVQDDGQGIDLKKVTAKALELGLFTSDQLHNMSDNDLQRLILNREFSTVIDKGKKPEDRGAALHIVKNNIEKLKGSIDISSTAGKGTLVRIRVPLNLVVIKALKVKAGEEVMALPVSCVEEILRVRNEVIFEEDGHKAINVHDMHLPVFKLTDVFNIEPAPSQDERVYIIIVQAEEQSIGLIVDETSGLEEIVIKPLGEFLRKESGFSGATIISDGNISLVPDIAEVIRIAQKLQVVPEESIA